MTRFRFPAVSVTALMFLACTGDTEKSADSATTSGDQTATIQAAGPGEALYQQRCLSCHQANGEGIPGTYPPLAGSEYAIAANPGVPARIVMHGISGPITVKGATYNSLMPPYGVGVAMTDDEVAALLTYVRSSFGNSASAVSSADVARAREGTKSHTGPMTVELLKPIMGGS